MNTLKILIPILLLITQISCTNIHLENEVLKDSLSDKTLRLPNGKRLFFSKNGTIYGSIYKEGHKGFVTIRRLSRPGGVSRNINIQYGTGFYILNNDTVEIYWPSHEYREQSTALFKLIKISDKEYLPCYKDDISDCDMSVVWKVYDGDIWHFKTRRRD